HRHRRTPLQAAERGARQRQFAFVAHVADDREPRLAALGRDGRMQPRRLEDTKKNHQILFFVCSCLRGCLFVGVAASPALAQSASKPVTFKGLEMSVTGLERAASASLKDCPPGDNRVNAMTRPGEEFAVVTVKFKVLPAFDKSTMLKK